MKIKFDNAMQGYVISDIRNGKHYSSGYKSNKENAIERFNKDFDKNSVKAEKEDYEKLKENTVKLTESQLIKVITETVKKVMNERSNTQSNSMMRNFIKKFGIVGDKLNDFQRFLSIYDSNPDDFNKINYILFSMIYDFPMGRSQVLMVELNNKFGISLRFNGSGKVDGFDENTYKEVVESIRNYVNQAQAELDKIREYENSID